MKIVFLLALIIMVLPSQATWASTLSDGLVAHWAAENNTQDSQHGTTAINNGVGFSAGKVGQAFNFNGSGDFIKEANRDDLTGMAALSLSAWVKSSPSLGGGCSRVIEIGNSSTDSVALVLDTSCGSSLQGSIRGWVHTNGSRKEIQLKDKNYNDDLWHFLAFTYDGSQMRLYVDGELKVTGSASGLTDNAPHVLIGQHVFSNPDNGHTFGGLLDEIAVHNRALSQQEVSEAFNVGSTGTSFAIGAPVPEANSLILLLLGIFSVAMFKGRTVS